MSLIEIIIISVGISLNVFSVVVCFGAVILKVEKSRLAKMIAIFCIMQALAAAGGEYLMSVPAIEDTLKYFTPMCALLAVIIFSVLGVYMLYKAVKNEPIMERLTDIKYSQVFVTSLITGIDAFLAGVAFGLMNTPVLPVCVCILVVTAVVVIFGLYTGQRLGYEHKTQSYAIGGLLLLCTAAEIVVRYMIEWHP